MFFFPKPSFGKVLKHAVDFPEGQQREEIIMYNNIITITLRVQTCGLSDELGNKNYRHTAKLKAKKRKNHRFQKRRRKSQEPQWEGLLDSPSSQRNRGYHLSVYTSAAQ